MKTINGHKYSRESFPEYQLRLIIEITDINDDDHRIDIYTTQTSVDAAWDDLLDITTDRVKTFSIVHSATKKQDENASEMINDWLNET